MIFITLSKFPLDLASVDEYIFLNKVCHSLGLATSSRSPVKVIANVRQCPQVSRDTMIGLNTGMGERKRKKKLH